MKYWQVAAGDKGRNYSKLFLDHGIAFVGGEKHEKRIDDDVNINDIMVLKDGIHGILAAGKVVSRGGVHKGNGDKEWLHDFDGWDLPAYCYVDWKKSNTPGQKIIGLTQGTILEIHESSPQQTANNILSTGTSVTFKKEPKSCRSITDTELLQVLVTKGLSPTRAVDLTNTISKIRLLADYYFKDISQGWEDVREHESRTFLVIPLLIALGWTEQQLKIELPVPTKITKNNKNNNRKKRIDIACFKSNYNKNNDECVAIIETKSFSSGLNEAEEQVKGYASSPSFKNCEVLITTNGYCYKIYIKSNGSFSSIPSAYLNILHPKDKYPLDPCNVGGALDAIIHLLPC